MSEHKILGSYLAQVADALREAGAAPAEIADIQACLREHVHEAISQDGADINAIVASLDPPTAFVERFGETAVGAKTSDREYMFGGAGFFGGLIVFVTAFLILPNIDPALMERMSAPLILTAIVFSASLGFAGRNTKFGKASLALAAGMTGLFAFLITRGG